MSNVSIITLPHEQYRILVTDEVTGPAERRKLQNRVNQRMYRRRKMLSKKSPEIVAVNSKPVSLLHQTTENAVRHLFHSAADASPLPLSEFPGARKLCHLSPTEVNKVIIVFEQWVTSTTNSSLHSDRLLVLVKFNVFRALIANSATLGIVGESTMDDEALSPFSNPQPLVGENLEVSQLPVALRPTTLQRRIQHHPWIDLLPVPEMRDNLLRAGDTWDDMELCGDLVGFFSAPSGKMRTGMVIWGEPYDIDGLEITEDFLKHWGWTIKGCDSIVRSTNRWRAKRGEEPLDFTTLEIEEEISPA